MRGNPIPPTAGSEVLEVVIGVSCRAGITRHGNGLVLARAQGLTRLRTGPRSCSSGLTAEYGNTRCEHRRRSRGRPRDRTPNELAKPPNHVLERRRLGIEFLGGAGAF